MQNVPEFKVQVHNNDITMLVRLQQLSNGFVVRGCKSPIHYSNIEEAAEAVKLGIIKSDWNKSDKKKG